MKLVVVSHNKGKVREIKYILNNYEIFSLDDIGYNKVIEENGNSFYENALLKAKTVYNDIGKVYNDFFFISDDSGLEIDALNGRPGIHSARYAGENATQEQLINKVLNEMKNIPMEKRQARFICSIVVINPEGNHFEFKGICEGYISFEPRGTNGFGYDPIFLPIEYNNKKTMAELSNEEKNLISHRGKALRDLKNYFSQLQNNNN